MRTLPLILASMLLLSCGSDSADGWTFSDSRNNQNNANNTNNVNNVNNVNNQNHANIVADAGQDLTMVEDMNVVFPPFEGESALSFFSLPIGSYRLAVSRYDKDLDVCVSLIFFMNTPIGGPLEQMCAEDFDGDDFNPYVVVADEPDCWDYGAEAELLSAEGCVAFEELGAPADWADIRIEIQSDLYSGPVEFKTP